MATRSSSKPKNARDTAKDIILGLEPSGRGPRKPKEGVAQTPVRKSPTQTIVVQKQDTNAISNLQNQISQLRKQYNDLLNSEQAARRRIESNQDVLHKKITGIDTGASNRSVDDLRKQLLLIESKMNSLGHEMGNMKGAVDRHTADINSVHTDVKNRPIFDPNKFATAQQQIDLRLRDSHTQMAQLKQALESEVHDRIRAQQEHSNTLTRLQDFMKQQEAVKNDTIASMSRKHDIEKEKLVEENRRLNDKLSAMMADINKSLNDREQRLKDELTQKYGALSAALKTQSDAMLENEKGNRKSLEERFKQHEGMLDELRTTQQNDKNKNKEKFGKVNEALAALELHLEQGNQKMDKILNSEIQSRKLHEKGLLAKVNDVEDKLSNYLQGLAKSVEDAKAGKENVKVPSLDTDALRREMEAISADKNKMSMEGLLKLEEKISRIQHGLNRDRRQMVDQLNDMNDKDQLTKLKLQVGKLDDILDDVEKTQDRVRDKVERQIPQDLNELSAKVDNLKQQVTHRIDQEEEERYLAIKELQDAYNKMGPRAPHNSSSSGDASASNNNALRRDIEECKVAIKKLAESVTTVKNVLDRKIIDEIRKREQEIERLESRMGRPPPPQGQYPPNTRPPAPQQQPR